MTATYSRRCWAYYLVALALTLATFRCETVAAEFDRHVGAHISDHHHRVEVVAQKQHDQQHSHQRHPHQRTDFAGDCPPCQRPPVGGQHRHAAGNACARAGDPHQVAWYARPSRNKHDSLGYVGGGAAWRGAPRTSEDGTWGLDYAGLFSKRHIWLKWLHGRPSRQTGGSYNSDGPHFLPR